jgi:ketosteroid isomerase-like protein
MTEPTAAPADGAFDGYGTGDAAVRLALATGDVTTEVAEKVSPLPGMTAADRERLANEALTELHARHLLADVERDRLGDSVAAVFAADLSQQGKVERTDEALRALLAQRAGPVALAIASVAATSAHTVAVRVERHVRQPDDLAFDIGDFSTWQECACAGGLVGATAGIPFGPGGVLLFAAAGAAGGAAASVVADAILS